MASLIRPMQRSLFQLNKLVAIRCKSDASVSEAPVDKSPNLEKRELIPGEDPKKAYFPNPWDVVEGAERFELAMKAKGYNDPYDMEPLNINKNSTKDKPNVIYAFGKERLVGCVCEEDTHHIVYMNLTMNETKRCACGHWFTLKTREIPDLSEFGIKLLNPDEAHH